MSRYAVYKINRIKRSVSVDTHDRLPLLEGTVTRCILQLAMFWHSAGIIGGAKDGICPFLSPDV